MIQYEWDYHGVTQMNIAFVGGGIMAEAIISGILQHGLAKPQDILVSDPIVQRRQHLKNEYGINTTDNNLEAVSNSDIFVLAIKIALFSI